MGKNKALRVVVALIMVTKEGRERGLYTATKDQLRGLYGPRKRAVLQKI